jgi:S-adenosylmethionine:tRNA ribosyltransferase-isomerase
VRTPVAELASAAPARPLRELREADRPPEERGLGRDGVLMLVGYPGDGDLVHAHFRDLPEILAPGDLLVVNISRTLPAALPARTSSGSQVALHLSTPVPDDTAGRWVVELRSADGRRRHGHAAELLRLPDGAEAELLAAYLGTRLWVAELRLGEPLLDYLNRHGRPIRYPHTAGEWPLEAYQNVYATEPGSAEMPSAGRPLTPEAITALVARGVDVAPVVLHTGVSSLERGESPYPERFRVPESTAERANLTRRLGGRIVAVGTTVVRALESAAAPDGRVEASAGWTDLVIGKERPVRAVDGILTGFHDRDSSHMQLLEAIAGGELLDSMYEAALENGYLRHEFGDLMVVLPSRG